jgi:hypothetical protein
MYCVCEAAQDRFKTIIEEHGHEKTAAVMEHDINKCDTYTVSVRLNKFMEQKKKTISHIDMCKYNGVRQLDGQIKEMFDCKCVAEEETQHCNRPQQIYIKVEENGSLETDEYDNNLHCEKMHKTETPVRSLSVGLIHRSPAIKTIRAHSCPNKARKMLTLSQILETEMVKAHRQGIVT